MVIRTFSKFYGLAGARLGYVLGDPEAIQAYDTVTEPFNTNRTAIAGASAALQFDQIESNKARKKFSVIVKDWLSRWDFWASELPRPKLILCLPNFPMAPLTRQLLSTPS